MREELTVVNADDMLALGRRLAAVLLPGDLVVLSGDLGAGKTTLVQGIGAGLGVRGPITSPTFVIARVHPSLTGGPALVHADAYRLNSPAEVDDLDLDASLETSVTVVEWGGGLVEGLAPDRLDVSIALAAPGPGPGGVPGGASPANETSPDDGPGPDDGTSPDNGLGPDQEPEPDQEQRTVRLEGHGARWEGVDGLPPAGSAAAPGAAQAGRVPAGRTSAPGGAQAGPVPAGRTSGPDGAQAGGVFTGRTPASRPSPGGGTAG
jgi:tRNA threonylcarbamoyladenosine biosynthesis protein TsaE